MQVVRLEIFGFKSFMDRLVLPLDQGLTGVVGPNGCGKSNIVDAVRWVLGESRATRIRGSTLEDVIFNGTEKVRPLGLAEVTVTLRASSDNFFEDILSEQSHSSEFELSTAMSEVDSALAVHKASQSDSDSSGDEKPKADVQSDNEVSDAITDKGRPRLRVIDGRLGDADSRAADVEGAGSREDDAVEQPGLDNQTSEQTKGSTAVKAQVNPAETSLTQRFAWLGSTNEVQVTRRYYRSGESEYYINRVPCRLKDISELFNAVGLGPRAFTIVAQDQVSRIVTAKPEQRRLILEEAAGVQGFRDKIGAANRRLSETATNVSRLDDIIREVQRQVSSLKRQAAKARNREALRTQILSLIHI